MVLIFQQITEQTLLYKQYFTENVPSNKANIVKGNIYMTSMYCLMS